MIIKTISIIFKALYKHEIYDKNLKKEIEKVENKIDFEIENVKSFEDIPKPIKKKVVKINKEYSEEVLKLFEILPLEEQIETSKERLENLLKDHTFKYIEADIKYAKKSKAKNFWGYLIKSINSGHYSKDELEKSKIKELKKIKQEEEEIKKKREEEEKEEQNNQEIKELIEYFTEQEKEKHYNEYLNDKYTLKEVVSFNNYLIVKIDYDKILKLELQKRKIKEKKK